MPAGMEVRNANNATILLIDATYSNLVFAGKVVLTLNQYGSSSGSCVMGTFDTNQRIPFIGFYSGVPVATRSQQVNANTWRHFVYAIAPLNTAIECYLFDDSTQVTPGNYGLNVFDASARLVFTSNAKYLKVIGQIQGSDADTDPSWNNPSTGTWANKTFSFPGVARPLLVQSMFPLYATLGAGANPDRYSVMTFLMCGKTSPGSINLGYQIQATFDNLAGSTVPATQPAYLWLVLDGALLG